MPDPVPVPATADSAADEAPHEAGASGLMAPLREPVFRRIWVASLFSNLGQQMQAVAAAWTMLEITHRADLVALVQTATSLPMMLLAVAAGALADMYDRRKVALVALSVCFLGAAALAVAAGTGNVTPAVILVCCFVVGIGVTVFSPAWLASAGEVVGTRAMPAAIALFSLSFNAARSVGPAVGGILVAAAGMTFAFSLNAALYLPIIVALLMWKRRAVPPRLPPERMDRAMLAGVRFVRHSPSVRRVIFRALASSLGGAAIYALLPLIANDLLKGDATTYGVLLGAFGLGAVLFGLGTERLRQRLEPETIIQGCTVVTAGSLLLAAFSPWLALTALATHLLGGAWMIMTSCYTVSIQLGSPRWVSGRSLATFQTAIAGGLAGGAILWGHVASDHGVVFALTLAAALTAATLLLGLAMPLGADASAEPAPPVSYDAVIKMALTGRSGPIAVELEYRVPVGQARPFYHALRELRRSRERNGAFETSISRDIEDPELWVERFHYPTWNDYLRARDRPTVDDRELRNRAFSFHEGPDEPKVRRFLERPTGSVRFREDALDPGEALKMPFVLSSG